MIVFGFWAELAKFTLPSIHIAVVDVSVTSNAVRNLGVMFDTGMSRKALYLSIAQ